MLKDLVKVANRLDSLGLTREADTLDILVKKMAAMNEEWMERLTIYMQKTNDLRA